MHILHVEMIPPEAETEIYTDRTDIAWQGFGCNVPSGCYELAGNDGSAVPDGCL